MEHLNQGYGPWVAPQPINQIMELEYDPDMDHLVIDYQHKEDIVCSGLNILSEDGVDTCEKCGGSLEVIRFKDLSDFDKWYVLIRMKLDRQKLQKLKISMGLD